MNAKYAPAYNSISAIRFKQEKYKEAEAEAAKAIKIDPNYASAYVNRGIAREMMRNQEGACADWQKAQDLGHELGKKYLIGNCN